MLLGRRPGDKRSKTPISSAGWGSSSHGRGACAHEQCATHHALLDRHQCGHLPHGVGERSVQTVFSADRSPRLPAHQHHCDHRHWQLDHLSLGLGSSLAVRGSMRPTGRSSGRSAPLGTTARSPAGAPILSAWLWPEMDAALIASRGGGIPPATPRRQVISPAVSAQPAVPTAGRAEPGRESSHSR